MKKTVVLIGKESVGKSQLIRSITGKNALSEKLKGTTLAVQTYETDQFCFIDTPGILLNSDSATTKLALQEIQEKQCVVIVISATSIDQDLSDLLPMVKEKPGAIVITQWDRMKKRIDPEALQKIEDELELPLLKVDARNISLNEKEQLLNSFANPRVFKITKADSLINVTLEPRKDVFDVPFIGKFLSIVLLFVPPWFAVKYANLFADTFYDTVFAGLSSILNIINVMPAPVNHLLGMDYGIIAMFPFLLLYALPTVFLFAMILSLYKSSGLIDRITVSVHQLVIPIGITGRDVVRVIMGFGCNVPAVISTRTCSGITRGNCISAISFGTACSYQLPATVAVFAAAKMDFLIIPYLLILAGTTITYLWITSTKKTKLLKDELTLLKRDFLQLPRLQPMVAEGKSMVHAFLTVAFPIFIVICLVAAMLNWLGVLSGLSWLLAPMMAFFNLPAEAATSVVLGSIRKDGIAIGLLNSSWDGLKIPITDPVQVLTVVYLAGILLPCLVTLYTISKEMNLKFAFQIIHKQVLAVITFSLLIAWIGHLLF